MWGLKSEDYSTGSRACWRRWHHEETHTHRSSMWPSSRSPPHLSPRFHRLLLLNLPCAALPSRSCVFPALWWNGLMKTSITSQKNTTVTFVVSPRVSQLCLHVSPRHRSALRSARGRMRQLSTPAGEAPASSSWVFMLWPTSTCIQSSLWQRSGYSVWHRRVFDGWSSSAAVGGAGTGRGTAQCLNRRNQRCWDNQLGQEKQVLRWKTEPCKLFFMFYKGPRINWSWSWNHIRTQNLLRPSWMKRSVFNVCVVFLLLLFLLLSLLVSW